MTTAPSRTLQIPNIDVVALDGADIRGFTCGEKEIDDWLEKSPQLDKTHRARVFCAIEKGSRELLGFYSLSITGMHAKGLGDEVQYHNKGGVVAFIYIDFLAVRKDVQQQKLGTFLLINALSRCYLIAQHVGVFGVALNSLNERTTALYAKYGFAVRGDKKLTHPLMILPMQFVFDEMARAPVPGFSPAVSTEPKWP